jgi:hypothetical protein
LKKNAKANAWWIQQECTSRPEEMIELAISTAKQQLNRRYDAPTAQLIHFIFIFTNYLHKN